MKRKSQQTIIIASVVIVAVIAVGALILLSGRTTGSSIDYGTIPQSRAEDGSFVLGNPDAPITVVEFADYACPSCQRYKETMDRFIREFVVTGKARFEFHAFPTAGQELMVFASQIGECVDELSPGAYWQAYEILYELGMTGRFNQNIGREVTSRLGLDYSRVLECRNTAEQTQKDIELGRRLGVTGTPAVAVRYGDSDPTWISVGGLVYSPDNRQLGAIPSFEVLKAVVEQSQ